MQSDEHRQSSRSPLTSRARWTVAALIILAALGFVATLAFAANACPAELAGQPCPDAGLNRAVVIALVATSAGLTITPFAFLGELAVRRIEYRGAWMRAARRGGLVGAVLAVVGGLRLGDALSVPAALFVVALAGAVEWIWARSLDTR